MLGHAYAFHLFLGAFQAPSSVQESEQGTEAICRGDVEAAAQQTSVTDTYPGHDTAASDIARHLQYQSVSHIQGYQE